MTLVFSAIFSAGSVEQTHTGPGRLHLMQMARPIVTCSPRSGTFLGFECKLLDLVIPRRKLTPVESGGHTGQPFCQIGSKKIRSRDFEEIQISEECGVDT
jgi:hypothetical protein